MSEEQKPLGDEPKRKKRARQRKKLTHREAEFLKNRLAGMTLLQSATLAGYAPYRQQGHRVEQQIAEKGGAAAAFNRAGVTMDRLARKVDFLLEAKRKQHFTSIVLETKEDDALEIQSKAVDFSLRVHGALKPIDDAASKSADTAQGNTVCLVVCDERAAASLAGLFAPRSPSGPVINVDAEVD